MDMRFAFEGLVVLVVGGSIGYVIWWCWVCPRNQERQGDLCERCGREVELLVPVRMINDSTRPSYEMLVCEPCVEDLREAARQCRRCGRSAVHKGRNRAGADIYQCAAGHVMLSRHGTNYTGKLRERRAQ